MLHPARIKQLRELPVNHNAQYVLYWMQQSQRTRFNHALEFAAQQANELNLPLVACFGLMDDYPEANQRHYAFMLQGLADVQANLHKRNILFVLKHGQPAEVAAHFSKNAALIVCDRGYLRHQKAWRAQLAANAKAPVYQIESDAVVPVEVASNKREFAARTIRPKITHHLPEYLTPLPITSVKNSSLNLKIKGDLDPKDWEKTLQKLKLDRSIPLATTHFTGGENHAHQRYQTFLKTKFKGYAHNRNEPAASGTSKMAPYLHFGQVSPVELALLALKSTNATLPQGKTKNTNPTPQSTNEDINSLIEELIVRRELSINYCENTENYDSYEALPPWARQTLKDHEKDERETTYTLAQLEAAQTHDQFWNAAQQEMLATGFMQNYMRMYWGKKILEWSTSPQQAYKTTLYLNNKYFLCGRDPNSYTSVAWIFGLHDRPWTKRKIFGTIRYMNAAGLARKYDMKAYINHVASLAT